MTTAQAKPAPEIKVVRNEGPRDRDFKVLINGEHRANFRSRARYSMKGYDYEAADGSAIHVARKHHFRLSDITKADFREIVELTLESIPTRAEIERSLLIDEANREHRKWQDDRSRNAAKLRRDVLREALGYYLTLTNEPTQRAMAEKMLAEVNGPLPLV